jgi:hypothetical protein
MFHTSKTGIKTGPLILMFRKRKRGISRPDLLMFYISKNEIKIRPLILMFRKPKKGIIRP